MRSLASRSLSVSGGGSRRVANQCTSAARVISFWASSVSGDVQPGSDKSLPGVGQLGLRRVTNFAGPQALLVDALDLAAYRVGTCDVPLGAVVGVTEGSLSLSAYCTRGRIGRDPLVPHHSGEVLAPLAEHRLVDV